MRHQTAEPDDSRGARARPHRLTLAPSAVALLLCAGLTGDAAAAPCWPSDHRPLVDASPRVDVAIVGGDDRRCIGSDCLGDGYQSTGILSDAKRALTGTVVHQRNLIVTVAHFFRGKSGRVLDPSILARTSFVLDNRHGTHRFRIVDAVFGRDEFTRGHRSRDDWAVLVLDRPVPTAIHPVALSDVDNSRQLRGHSVSLPAFHGDIALIGGGPPFRISTCSIDQAFEGVLAHDCDLRSGASGAALLDVSVPEDPRLVAIQSSNYENVAGMPDVNFAAFAGAELRAAVARLADRHKLPQDAFDAAGAVAGDRQWDHLDGAAAMPGAMPLSQVRK